jgi:peptidoglycan/xylan/chitin deacetylase (PgdA/CDA1 family)
MLNSRAVNICFSLIFFSIVSCDVFRQVPWWAYVTPLAVYLLLQVFGSLYLSAQFFLPVKFRASVQAGAVALTFDDGPIPQKTERVLDLLKARGVPAAFFCIGYRVKDHGGLVQRMHREGHLLGNHSYWHGKLFDLQPASAIADELRATDAAIQEAAGVVPRFFRPPYGVTNPMVAAAVKEAGHTTVGWSLRSFDTVTKDSAKLKARVTASLKAGDVILFHDYSDSMIEILPALLDHISSIGLKIVRIDELLNEKAYV